MSEKVLIEVPLDKIINDLERMKTKFQENKVAINSLSNAEKASGGAAEGLAKSNNVLSAGIRKVNMAMKTLYTNPLIAALAGILLVIKGIVSAIKGSEEKTMQLKAAMAAFTPIVNVVKNIFSALADVVLSVVSAISNFIGKLSSASNEQIKLVEAQNAYTKAVRDFNIEQSKAEADIELFRAKASELGADYQTRIDALNKAQEQQNELYLKKRELAEENLRLLQQEASYTDNNAEMNDKLAQAEIAVNNAIKEQYSHTRILIKEKQAMLKQMKSAGIITEEQYKEAIEETTSAIKEKNKALKQQLEIDIKILEPNVDKIKAEIDRLEEEYKTASSSRRKELENILKEQYVFYNDWKGALNSKKLELANIISGFDDFVEEKAVEVLKDSNTDVQKQERNLLDLLSLPALEKAKSYAEKYKKAVMEAFKTSGGADVISNLNSQYSESLGQISPTLGTFNIDDSGLDALQDETQLAISQMCEYWENYGETINGVVGSVSKSLNALGSTYQKIANDETKSAYEREEAARKLRIVQIAEALSTSGVAMAQGISQAMSLPFPGNLVAAATTLAELIALVAQIKNTMEYATGGVIGGYNGATMGKDNTYISARNGEMVLNANQQKRLFEIANNQGINTSNVDLVEAIKNIPAPILDYKEFSAFTKNISYIEDLTKFKNR